MVKYQLYIPSGIQTWVRKLEDRCEPHQLLRRLGHHAIFRHPYLLMIDFQFAQADLFFIILKMSKFLFFGPTAFFFGPVTGKVIDMNTLVDIE